MKKSRVATVLQSSILTCVLLLTAGPSWAEVVLAPLVIKGQTGQNGAFWITDFTIFNNSDQVWQDVWPESWCVLAVPMAIEARTAVKNAICPYEQGGVLLRVPNEIADLVSFQLRVRDRNSSAVAFGSEIPVVRESEFLRGASALLDVPGSRAFRRTFRVYNLSPSEAFEFTMKIHPLMSTDVVFETTAEIPASDHPFIPASVRFDDDQEVPDLEAFEDVTIEIIPDSSDVPYWWFGSIAGNSTNELTIISPQ